MSAALAKALIETLPTGVPGLFNPWQEACIVDEPWNTPDAKLERLAAHLDCRAEWLLCGEAPGYQGCRYSGIAFTSEKLLLDGCIPRVPSPGRRLTTRRLPFSEPSATIVWRVLYACGIAESTVLWNAVQLHPHSPDEIHSNRTPTDDELALGAAALGVLVQAYPSARIIAVGRNAEKALKAIKIPFADCIRHPANGGATEFAQGLNAAVEGVS